MNAGKVLYATLFCLAIPAGLASEADAMAFCADFAPQVAAAEEALVQAWSRCVAAGTRYARDRVAERCGGLLTHRDPDEWPANAEFFAARGRRCR